MNGLGEGTWGAMSRKRNVQKSFRLAIYSVVILIVVYRACQMRTSVCKKKKKENRKNGDKIGKCQGKNRVIAAKTGRWENAFTKQR